MECCVSISWQQEGRQGEGTNCLEDNNEGPISARWILTCGMKAKQTFTGILPGFYKVHPNLSLQSE